MIFFQLNAVKGRKSYGYGHGHGEMSTEHLAQGVGYGEGCGVS